MRVAVLGGGRSSEHDVSLASAAAVREGLQEAGHEPLAVEISRDGRWTVDGAGVTKTGYPRRATARGSSPSRSAT